MPQELGDFGLLIHSGWSQRRALVYNFASALTFTRLVHLGKHSQAGSLVEPHSAAARYIAHQLADTKAYKIDGLDDSNVEGDWTINGNDKTGKVLHDINLDDPNWKEAFLRPRQAHGTLIQLAQSR